MKYSALLRKKWLLPKLIFFCLLIPSASCLTPSKGVWFPSSTKLQTEQEPVSIQSSRKLFIFLHGRLEADDKDPKQPPMLPPPPAELYSQFCESLARETKSPVLMVDYHEVLASHLGQEPKTWQLGPVSRSIAGCIENETRDLPMVFPEGEERSIILVTFSMGAAMGLKLLQRQQQLQAILPIVPRIHKIILVEPVWRCWLSLAAREQPIVSHSTSDGNNVVPACLAVWGTLDRDTLMDSGKSVQGSLRPLLPQVETKALQGGNHWYILNDNVPFVKQGLLQNDKGVISAPRVLRRELVKEIAIFSNRSESGHS